MAGEVVQIFIASNAGRPMREVREVRAIKGLGLEGDRYAGDKGAWSKSRRRVIRQVSLIEREAIDRAGGKFSARETRRNIIVRNFPLNDLIGKKFVICGSIMRGVELCHPCPRPSELCGEKGFVEKFRGFGGLRAEILKTGVVKVGGDITLV